MRSIKEPAALSPGDWLKLRERVAGLRDVIEGASTRSPEEVKQALEERARALAIPPEGQAGEATLELITFGIGAETYALESRFVCEVFHSVNIAVLPAAETSLVGIAAWRGELLAVLDLRRALGLASGELCAPGLIVVVGETRPVFGIPVSSVGGLRRASLSSLPGVHQEVTQTLVQGITADAVVVLDGEYLVRTHT